MITANDKVLAYIRTAVPYAIGIALTGLLSMTGINLTGEFQLALIAFSVAAVTNMYYFLIRIIEVKYPVAGVFLGFPKQPVYGNVDNLWASFVRTAIPTLVGAAIVTVGGLLIGIDPETQGVLIAVMVGVVETAYYTIARQIVEHYPVFTFLLGAQSKPAYKGKHIKE